MENKQLAFKTDDGWNGETETLTPEAVIETYMREAAALMPDGIAFTEGSLNRLLFQIHAQALAKVLDRIVTR